MSRRLWVRLNEDASYVSWVATDDGAPQGEVQHGSVEDLAGVANAPLVVVVPAEEVFLTRIPLPGKNRQRLLNAVPYAVEDQLVDDIEDLHFALSDQDARGRYWVAAVNKERMQTWFEALDGAGLRLEAMIPDALALRADAAEASVIVERERAVVRLAHSAFACELHNLSLLLNNALRGLEPELEPEHPPRVQLFQCAGEHIAYLPAQLDEAIEVQEQACPQGLLGVIAGQGGNRDSVNLLHGPYSRREKLGKHLRPWSMPAAVFGLWLLLVLGLQVYQYLGLKQRADSLHQQMVSVYKRAFPAAQKVPPAGYVRQQMEQRINELQRERGESETSFQAMLTRSAPVFAGMKGVTLTAVRYYDGQMDVELNLQQADQLQALSDELSQRTGWQVQVQSAATRDELTQVRLQIKGNTG